MAQIIDVNVNINDKDASSKVAKLEHNVYEFKRDAETPVKIRIDTTTVKDAEGKVKKLVETARYASGEIDAVTKKANKVTATTKTEKDNADAIERRMRNLDAYMRLREQVAANEEKAALKESAAAKRSSQEQEQAHRKKMQSLQEQMRLSETIERTTNKAASLYAKGDMQGYQAAIQYLKELGVAVDEAAIKEKALQSAAQGAGKATEDAGKRSEEAANRANKASKAFGLLHTIFLRLAHTAISRVTRAFRQSFTEMQNVDKQLTTVSRITQTSISNLDGLKEKAYEVGSAYGVMASDYLSGVAAFTRAGYREQAEDLAELSTKLQVAGEVSAETANQLLIATDKAYGFNGSVTELSSIMDKMTYVDHNYATSVEKIAEGMGIVAPVAAQAHMSVDELIASLGTITAVTQRSGSESARALRALILSILKDTTTELEDGVTMTVDEINSVQDALKKYAPEVVAAAEATGKLIDPMEAIAALSKSFEEGILDEQGLAKITSALGGKLRASQLLSLIQNFSGMYTDMMKGMGNSMGIVDKDMERYLDSWQGKLNQLKNSFAGFTESIFDTDAIKGFIDAINYLIQAIDNPEEFGDKFASAFESAVHSIAENAPRILNSINKVATMVVKSVLSSLAKEAPDFMQNVLTDGIKDTFSMISENLPELAGDLFNLIGTLIVQGIVNADLASIIANELIAGIIKAIPNAVGGLFSAFEGFIGYSNGGGETDWLEQFAKVTGTSGQYTLAKSLFSWIFGTDTDKADEDSKKFKKSANDVKNTLEDVEDFIAKKRNKSGSNIIDDAAKSVESLNDKLKTATKSLEEYKKALDGGEKGDTLKSYAEAYKTATEMFEKGLTGSNAYMSAIDLILPDDVMRELHYDYEEAGKLLGNDFVKAMFEGGGDDYGANAANYIRTHLDEFKGVAIKEAEDGTFSLMVTDMEAFAESAKVAESALWALLDSLDIWNSKTTYTREELLSLVGATEDAGESYVNVTEAVDKLVSEGKSEREIKQIIGSLQELAETDPSIHLQEPEDDLDKIIQKIKDAHDKAEENGVDIVVTSNADEVFGGIWDEINNVDGTKVYIGVVYVPENSPQSGSGSSTPYWDRATSGGGGGKPNTRYASGTKSSVGGIALVNDGGGAELISANGKAWIAGGGEPTLTNLPQGSTVFNAKQTREILTRSGTPAFGGGTGWVGGIPLEGKDILGGKKLTKNLEKILDELSKYIDDILKKAKKALDKQLKAIDEQIEALEKEHDAEEDKNKLEELRLKILEAEKRLEEAKNERTVRYFNKETGQWEWMADQKAVHDAEQALKEAQEAYDKEVAEQEYQAKLQELKDQKEALQKQYDDLAEHWEEILEAIQEAGKEGVDFEEILKKLGLSGEVTDDIRKLIEAILNYEKQLTDGTYEIPLDNETANRIMGGSVVDGSSGDTLTKLIGLSGGDMNAKGTSIYNSNITNTTGDVNYYINGLQIGSDMMDRPLSEILSRLSIYAN